MEDVQPNRVCTLPPRPHRPARPSLNCPFVINQRTNGGGGEMKGAEFAVTVADCGWLWSAGKLHGTRMLATVYDPPPGAPEDSFNLTAYFENPRVSVRLSYNYRSEFFETFDRNTPLTRTGSSRWMPVVVNVPDDVALTFDGAVTPARARNLVQFAGEKFRRARSMTMARSTTPASA